MEFVFIMHDFDGNCVHKKVVMPDQWKKGSREMDRGNYCSHSIPQKKCTSAIKCVIVK